MRTPTITLPTADTPLAAVAQPDTIGSVQPLPACCDRSINGTVSSSLAAKVLSWPWLRTYVLALAAVAQIVNVPVIHVKRPATLLFVTVIRVRVVVVVTIIVVCRYR